MKNKKKTIHPAGKIIQDYCKTNNVSMRSLSQRIGASDKYVSDLVNGNSANPDHTHLRSLSEQTGIPFGKLATNDNASAIRIGGFMNDVIDQVEKSDLSASRKKDILDDVRFFCANWIMRDPGSIPADPRWIREKFSEWSPATFKVSAKRFSNIKSSINAALKTTGIIAGPKKPVAQLSGEWRELYDACKAHEAGQGKCWLSPALSPFIRYCDTNGIDPNDVSDETLTAFAEYRAAHDLSNGIAKKITGTRTAWNNALRNIPTWPHIKLCAGNKRKLLNYPLTEFPQSFQDDLDLYIETAGLHPSFCVTSKSSLERARQKRWIKEQQGRKKEITTLAETTLSSHIKSIHFVASAAVRHGIIAIEAVQSIGDVADVGVVSDVIEKDLKPRLGSSTQYASSVVHVMRSVATRWVIGISGDELMDFSGLKAELEADTNVGVMSDKDRKRIAPFLTDANNMATLVSFPAWVIEEAERVRKRTRNVTPDMARDVQASIMCLIEQTLPVRLGDLSRTKIDGNIIWPTKKGGSGMLHYMPSKTSRKNKHGQKKHLEVTLEPWKVKFLDTYVQHYLPLLRTEPTNIYLFPGDKPSEHKTYGAVSRQCTKIVKDWTGHTVNVHLWRKLMGGFLLMKTRQMELVENLLGHAKGSKATDVYAEMKTSWAAAELSKHITNLATSKGKLRTNTPQSCKWARR